MSLNLWVQRDGDEYEQQLGVMGVQKSQNYNGL